MIVRGSRDATMTDETVVAVVLLRDDGAALLQLRDEKPGLRHAGMWVMPGGHREGAESLEETGRREFLEETGYRCQALHWLLCFNNDHDLGWPAYQLAVFWARYDGVQSIECHEGQALEFVERTKADSLPMPDYLIKIWDAAIVSAHPPHYKPSQHLGDCAFRIADCELARWKKSAIRNSKSAMRKFWDEF